ncbi:MAG TPA: copper transporter [Actinomycetota bacterium]|nr:copper transporter [Actinomycetota bacterium]
MVSFRYHVVTIVAVFVALAVGILMGSTLLDQNLVHTLQNQTADMSQTISSLTKKVNDQQTQLNAVEKFVGDAMPSLVGGRLEGKQVILLTEHGIDLSTLNKVRQSLAGPDGAGASVQGVVVMNPSMTLSDPASRATAARILGVPASTSSARLSQELARALGDRLATGPPTATGQSDLLQEMVDAKLVTLSDAAGGAGAIGGADVPVVALSGSAPSTPVDARTFYVPLFDQLVANGTPTAAASSSTTSSPFLDQIRADGGVDGKILTVDDVDLAPGQVALVWGLQRLINGDDGGDYGLSCGTCSLAPSPAPTP